MLTNNGYDNTAVNKIECWKHQPEWEIAKNIQSSIISYNITATVSVGVWECGRVGGHGKPFDPS